MTPASHRPVDLRDNRTQDTRVQLIKDRWKVLSSPRHAKKKKKKRKNPLTIEEKYFALKQHATHQGCWQARGQLPGCVSGASPVRSKPGKTGRNSAKRGRDPEGREDSTLEHVPPNHHGSKNRTNRLPPQPRILSLTSGCWVCNPSQSLSLPSQLHRRLLTRDSSPNPGAALPGSESGQGDRGGRKEPRPLETHKGEARPPVLTVVHPMLPCSWGTHMGNFKMWKEARDKPCRTQDGTERVNKSVWSLVPQVSISLAHPYWLSVEELVNPKMFPALWTCIQSP